MASPVDHIQIRGTRVHNSKNINVNVPLNQIVEIAGVFGSGKSSLAQGVLYAEGSLHYREALSMYIRSSIRSTFGTGTELLNSLRLLMFAGQ